MPFFAFFKVKQFAVRIFRIGADFYLSFRINSKKYEILISMSFFQRNISMNTSALKIPGSPIGSSSAVGGGGSGGCSATNNSNLAKSMYGDGFNVLTPSNANGLTGGKSLRAGFRYNTSSNVLGHSTVN